MLSIHNLPNKLSGEKIIQVLRRDIFILFKKVLLFVLLIILPAIIFYAVIVSANPDLLTGEISWPLIMLLSSFYYLFIWLFFFFSFIDYYLDVWIITDERIIDIQQRGFFSRVISEQRLYRIQDVTSEAHGFFTTILKYGNVYIQTAGAKQRFLFQEVPEPEKVRNTIIKLAEKSKRNHKNDGESE